MLCVVVVVVGQLGETILDEASLCCIHADRCDTKSCIEVASL